MSVEDAASTTAQKQAQSAAPEQKDVLRIIAEVERSLGALRARADVGSQPDTQRLLVDEIERMKRELSRLGDERAQLLEKQLSLESQLASAHATRAVAEERARRAEESRSRFEQETLNSQISRETEFIKSLEARAAADHARADELERQCAEARHELAVAMSKLTAVLKITEKHAIRENELESEVESLRAEVEVARKIQREGHISLGDAPETQEQIQQTIMPRLAQIAGFLSVRKQRLVNLHNALKRRAQALRVLRQLYQAQPQILAEEAEAVSAERAALEQERVEFEAQRAAIEKRAAELAVIETKLTRQNRVLSRVQHVGKVGSLVAAAMVLMAASAWMCWIVAASIAPKDAIATIELQTTTRGAAAAAADAAPIATWLTEMVGNDAFRGTVAGRLTDRGYSRDDADRLVGPLAETLNIEHVGSSIRLTLRATGVEQSVALLDAFAAVAISESARQPERNSDQLRLAVLGARQEVGRTVMAHGMLMKDETHLIRTGILFGMVLTLAGGGFAFFTLQTRRALIAASKPAAAVGESTPAPAKPAAKK
ncbi:MAG: hypothetical protein RLY21_2243 [Planctomycetota bacterium]|jgi:hypothetical protein